MTAGKRHCLHRGGARPRRPGQQTRSGHDRDLSPKPLPLRRQAPGTVSKKGAVFGGLFPGSGRWEDRGQERLCADLGRTRLLHAPVHGAAGCVRPSPRSSDASEVSVMLCVFVHRSRLRMSCAVAPRSLDGRECAALCSRLVGPWDGASERHSVRIAGACRGVVPKEVGLRSVCCRLLAAQAWAAVEVPRTPLVPTPPDRSLPELSHPHWHPSGTH